MTVTLRLFAHAREAAGTDRQAFDAATLGDLIDQAAAAFGDDFGAVLSRAKVWVNGEEPVAGPATLLADGDEVAVLPPVSGG